MINIFINRVRSGEVKEYDHSFLFICRAKGCLEKLHSYPIGKGFKSRVETIQCRKGHWNYAQRKDEKGKVFLKFFGILKIPFPTFVL